MNSCDRIKVSDCTIEKEHEAILKEEQKRLLENFDVKKINNYLKKEKRLSEESIKTNNNNSGTTVNSTIGAIQVTCSNALF